MFCLTLAACGEHEVHFAEEPAFFFDSVMEVEEVKVVLPQAGDVELVEQYCVPCHSLRYIEMQPSMTHKTWQKVVDKMIKTYGAPIHDSETVERIVNYLWAIKKG
jgi:hypothetical protein